jgi:hypothetical protein
MRHATRLPIGLPCAAAMLLFGSIAFLVLHHFGWLTPFPLF